LKPSSLRIQFFSTKNKVLGILFFFFLKKKSRHRDLEEINSYGEEVYGFFHELEFHEKYQQEFVNLVLFLSQNPIFLDEEERMLLNNFRNTKDSINLLNLFMKILKTKNEDPLS